MNAIAPKSKLALFSVFISFFSFLVSYDGIEPPFFSYKGNGLSNVLIGDFLVEGGFEPPHRSTSTPRSYSPLCA